MATDPAVALAVEMADAAGAIVESLSSQQIDAAFRPFPSDDRRLWFYTPTDHGGLPLTEMTSPQHRLVHRLLATSLSAPGYVTAALILGQENVLDHLEGFGVDFGRDRGRDPLLYWLRFFGRPEEDTWGWRFGGHHLSLNFTIDEGRVVSATPCFMGSDPASVPLLGPHLHRPLGGVEDLGRELARSLTGEQRLRGLLPVPPPDLVSANRSALSPGDGPLPLPLIWRGRFERDLDGLLSDLQSSLEQQLGWTADHDESLRFTSTPKGTSASTLDRGQRELLVEVLRTYIGRIDDSFADAQLARVADQLDDLRFLWAGGLEVGDPHYYRIQGGDLLVEFDNAQRGGNHVHTVWRDLSLDFGGDPLAEHYAHDH